MAEWVNFFLEAIINIQNKLIPKLKIKTTNIKLSPRD